jgi:hypothetical protein
MILKSLDDQRVVKAVLTTLQKEFGKLKILWNDFANCGVHHEQDTKTKEITS